MPTRQHELRRAAGVFYTLDEAAEISRRSSNAMRLLRTKGRGPKFVKVDGRLVVSAEELDRWLNGNDSST
jgi:hypothetical protein